MWAIVFVSTIYVCAFIIGVVGNVGVIVALFRSRLWNSHRLTRSQSIGLRSRLFIFVLALSDLLVLITIPFSLSQILQVRWPFGALLCRAHAAVDLSGKFFSVVILTSMSIERYLVVCNRWRSTKFLGSVTLLSVGFGITFCVIIPILPQMAFTNTFEVPEDGNGTSTYTICLIQMPKHFEPLFINYTFVFGFACPLAVMSLCYLLLVRHVRRKFQERTVHKDDSTMHLRRPRYMCELTRSVWRIGIFHFSCWAPFWFFNVAPLLVDLFGLDIELTSDWFRTARLIANMLPYVNSAGNWIFYAFLNRDVRMYIYRKGASSQSNRKPTDALPSLSLSYRRPTVSPNDEDS